MIYHYLPTIKTNAKISEVKKDKKNKQTQSNINSKLDENNHMGSLNESFQHNMFRVIP